MPPPYTAETEKCVTSAGVAATIDVALALIEDDHDAELARRVARRLLVFMARPGQQAQLSVRLRTPASPRPTLRPVLDAITSNPRAPHSVPALAALIGVSSRHLGRMFVNDVGVTPMRYVDQVRLEAACAMLADRAEPLDTIAQRCGIGSSESLRRLFRHELGLTPSAFRLLQRSTTTTVTNPLRPSRHIHAATSSEPHPESRRDNPVQTFDPPQRYGGNTHGCHY
jgi:transcriptional regulator GlxA family with amidase domain